MGAERESGYSEDVCLPFGHFVLELAARSPERLVLKVLFLGQMALNFYSFYSITVQVFIIFVTLLKFEFKHLE